MNLLEICLSPDIGGLELFMFRTAKNLEENFNITNVVLENSNLSSYFKKEKLKYIPIPKASKFLPLLSAKKLAKIIEEKKIDIIHMHWGKDLALCALAKKMSKIKPCLFYTRNMKVTRYKNDFYHKFLYQEVDYYLPTTKQLAKELKKYISIIKNEQIKQIYMGSESPIFLEPYRKETLKKDFAGDSFLIGLFSRIEKFKGQDLLIKASNKLIQEGLDIKILIIGKNMDDKYLDELKSYVKKHKLKEKVLFMNFAKDINSLMQICDLIVLTSKEETFGLVLIEAMDLLVPVIASNKGGVLEIIEDEKSGLLFESQNIKSLEDKIRKMYEDEKLRARLSKNAKERVNELFNSQKQFDKLKDIFLEVSI